MWFADVEEDMKELQADLDSGNLPPAEQEAVRQALEDMKSGRMQKRAKMLKSTRVVGASLPPSCSIGC